jgi:hypothetical protein
MLKVQILTPKGKSEVKKQTHSRSSFEKFQTSKLKKKDLGRMIKM